VHNFKNRRARKLDPLTALFVAVGLAFAATLALQINAQAVPGISATSGSASIQAVQRAD